MVFQDPMTSLNPVMRIGNQITESLRYHLDMDKQRGPRDRRRSCCGPSGSPSPTSGFASYPHEMSGGMRQRVVIAIALACGPKLLFADEPTTALDVTVQAQILDLLAEQQRERYMAMILVTHDLGVVAGRADEIAVMYAGTDRREGAHRRAVPRHEDARTPRRCSADPQLDERVPHPPRRHRRSSARPGQPAVRLPVQPALPVRPGPLP